jgi:hypothetical protein
VYLHQFVESFFIRLFVMTSTAPAEFFVDDYPDLAEQYGGEWKGVGVLDEYAVSDAGLVYNLKKSELVKETSNSFGYSRVMIDGKVRIPSKLVAENFVAGRTAQRCFVHRIDGDRKNNHASNLRWVSTTEAVDLRKERAAGTPRAPVVQKTISPKHLDGARTILAGRWTLSDADDHWRSTRGNATVEIYRNGYRCSLTVAGWLYAVEHMLSVVPTQRQIARLCLEPTCVSPHHYVLTSSPWTKLETEGDWKYLAAMIKNNCKLEDNGCLTWIGAVSKGETLYRTLPAHHFVYFLRHRVRSLPESTFLSRTCGNAKCVEHTHLALRNTVPRDTVEVTDDFCQEAKILIEEMSTPTDDHWLVLSQPRFSQPVPKGTKFSYPRAPFRGRDWLLHRLSWVSHNGRMPPEGMVVRHKCRRRDCISPDHLEIGTHKQNNYDDKVRDGTLNRGKRSRSTKTTDEQARAIKHSRGDGTQAERAVRFGVPRHTIGNIDRGHAFYYID